MKKPFWDLEERKGFVPIYNSDTRKKFYVQNKGRKKLAGEKLNKLYIKLDKILVFLKDRRHIWKDSEYSPGIQLLLKHHYKKNQS